MAKYEPYEVEYMITTYKFADTDQDRKLAVQVIADKLQRSVQSVIAKLAREHVYVKPTRTSKTGDPITRKDELVRAIEILLGIPDLESFEKASKRDLTKVIEALKTQSYKHELER